MRISDWSSDVFSSDLRQVRCPIAVPSQGCSNAACRAPGVVAGLSAELGGPNLQRPTHMLRLQLSDRGDSKALADGVAKSLGPLNRIEIGRASCRERVCQYV